MKALKVILTIIIVVLLLATILFNIKNIFDYIIIDKIATQAEYEIESTMSYVQTDEYHISVMPCNKDYVEKKIHEGSRYYLVVIMTDYNQYGYGNYTETFLAEYNKGLIVFKNI